MWSSCFIYVFCIYFHIRWCSCRLTLTRQVSRVKEELPTVAEHLSSPLVFSGVRVAQYLGFSVMFCISLLSLCPFYFGHYCLSFVLPNQITHCVSCGHYCLSFVLPYQITPLVSCGHYCLSFVLPYQITPLVYCGHYCLSFVLPY